MGTPHFSIMRWGNGYHDEVMDGVMGDNEKNYCLLPVDL